MTHTKDISIIVPTYKRPEDITRALGSAVTQDTGRYSFEIIVADNDPLGSAYDAVHAIMGRNAKVDLIYIHVPEPGVSNARNGALKVAKGRFLIFLDDDMEANADWAFQLADAAERLSSAIVFGPVEAVMPDGDNPLYPHMQPLFSRTGDFADGHINALFGTGGCLIDRGQCSLPSPAFDPTLNEVGGEDDAMFAHILAQGAKIGWTTKAIAVEHIPTHRSTPAYVWTRNFAFGQGPSQNEADKGFSGAFGVMKWMGVGVVQAFIYGPQYLLRRVLGRADYIRSYARLSQAIGKVLWFDGFSPRLYGANATTAKDTAQKAAS